MSTPQPTGITVHNKSRLLELSYDDGASFSIPFELLRVYSPSAEVRGHGEGQEVLQVGKREVGIAGIEPVGNYAIQPPSATATIPACSPGTICTSWAASRKNCGPTTWRACTRPALKATAAVSPAPSPPPAPRPITAAATTTESTVSAQRGRCLALPRIRAGFHPLVMGLWNSCAPDACARDGQTVRPSRAEAQAFSMIGGSARRQPES